MYCHYCILFYFARVSTSHKTIFLTNSSWLMRIHKNILIYYILKCFLEFICTDELDDFIKTFIYPSSFTTYNSMFYILVTAAKHL